MAFKIDAPIKFPDWENWEVSARSDSWINIMWLKMQMVKKNDELDYILVGVRSIPDLTRYDFLRACCFLDGTYDLNYDGGRPVVHFNCNSKVVKDAQNRPEVKVGFWVNDDRYSKLVPVWRSEVKRWLGAERMFYVYDCDSAGMFLRGSEDDNFYLAACSEGETIPDRDLFSNLLSAPVQTAYKWHCVRTNRAPAMQSVRVDFIDRKILREHLGLALTLLTDAMAKEALPKENYYEWFRENLVTGTISRRFLLSQRILKSFGCNAVSKPVLPDCSEHKFWAIWDHLMEMTVMLLTVQSDEECPILPVFFRIVLENHCQDHHHLLLAALAQPKVCSRALQVMKVCWTKIAEDSQLQQCFLDQLILLLPWKGDVICKEAVEILAEIIAKEPKLEQYVKSDKNLNLCITVGMESNPELLVKAVFLQILFEMNSTVSNQHHKQELQMICSELLLHPEGKVRFWAVLLIATLPPAEFPKLRKRFQGLLRDPAAKVRVAALEAWILSYTRQSDNDGISIGILLTMVSANSSSFVRREIADVLIAVIVVNRMKELIAVCKQESTDAKQQLSKGKAKAKQHAKVGSQAIKPDTDLGRAWRTMVALQNDPDHTVATSMRSVVTFVKDRVTELESNDKKKKKKASNEHEFQVPPRKPLYDRFRRDLLDLSEELVTVDSAEHCDSRVSDGGSTAARLPTLPLLNHQLKCFNEQKVPEMLRLGSDRQLATVCKDHVTWRDYTTEFVAHLKAPATVTSLLFDTDRSNLLLGCVDGSVHQWHSRSESNPTLVNAWQALYDLDSATSPRALGGMTMTSFGNGRLLTGGDAKYLRKWDLEKELTQGDVCIGTDQTVTCLTSDGNNLVAAGLKNGTIRLFDLRAEAGGKVAVGPKHCNPVRAISLRPDGVSIVSACSGRSVHLVDIRKMIPATKKWTVDSDPVDVAIHERLDLIAFAGDDMVEMYSIEGEMICGVDGFRSVCVGFHPRASVVGAGYERDGGIVILFDEEKD